MKNVEYSVFSSIIFCMFSGCAVCLRYIEKKMPEHVHESKAPFKKLIQCQFSSVRIFFQTATALLLFIALQNKNGTKVSSALS